MITIELKDAEIQAALSGLEALLADLSPVMNEIGDFLVTATKDRMAAGKTPEGSPFAPRSAATLAIYARRKITFGPTPLRQSGDMGQQIAHSYGPDSVQVGSNAIQAAVMQFGAVKGALGAYFYTGKGGGHVDGSSPWGDIPARPFLGLSDEDRSGILDIVSEALAAALQA